jgi:hypothetical protein
MNDIATRTNGIHPAIADHYEGMNEALHERDKLQHLASDLQNELTVTQRLNEQYQAQIDILTKERDFYYRNAYAFENKLRDMKGMIDGLFSLVKFEADNSPVQAPSTPSFDESAIGKAIMKEQYKMPSAANIEEEQGT